MSSVDINNQPRIDFVDGEIAVLKLVVQNPDTAAFEDPSTLVFTANVPESGGGGQLIYTYGTDTELVRDSLGHFHVDIDTTGAPGVWFYRFRGTGTAAGAGNRSFNVLPDTTVAPNC